METQRPQSAYRQIIKYTSMFGSVQVLNILAGLVRNKVAAVLLGPAGVGLASLMLTWQGLASQATNFGIHFGSIPRLSQLHESGNSEALVHEIGVMRAWSVVAALLGALLCVLAGPLACHAVFHSAEHATWFAWMAPAVAALALTGSETSILKATRQLGALARVQAIGAVGCTAVAVVFYYLMGIQGIVPVIVASALLMLLLTARSSLRCYPIGKMRSAAILKEGGGMLRLGVVFVIGGIVGQVAEFFVRTFLTNNGGLSDVGLYSAAYTLTISYAAIVFASVDSDYYPRISACNEARSMSSVANQQAEVLLMLASPLASLLMLALPWLLPLLYSGEFLSVIAVAQTAALAIYMKAVSLPVSYMPLARHDSTAYLVIETGYWAYFTVFVVTGYRLWGLEGMGVALVAAHVVEWCAGTCWAVFRYGYRPSPRLLLLLLLQGSIGTALCYATQHLSGVAYWVSGGLLLMLSVALSLRAFLKNR